MNFIGKEEIIDRLILLISKDSRSQKELCDYTGIKTSTLGNWLNRHTDPHAKYIIPICDFFNVTPEYLLTGEEIPKDKTISSSDAEWLALIHKLPIEAQYEFRGEIKGYLKRLNEESEENEAPMRQAK